MESDQREPPKGQVCDRCRQKKIKCDGATPACSNCASSGSTCETSAKLRRKTTIRGYNTSSTYVEGLEAEIAQLKARLQSQIEKTNALQTELDLAHQSLGRPLKLRKVAYSNIAHSPATMSGESEVSSHPRTAFVVKHMGRMVFDQAEIGRFAGSTTGVHFVASVEELCRRYFPSLRAFPEDCFRLHLSQISDLSENTLSFINAQHIQDTLPESIEYYVKQVDIFNDAWLALCPVVPRYNFVQEVGRALRALRAYDALDSNMICSIQSFAAILLVNTCASGVQEHQNKAKALFDLYWSLHHIAITRSNLQNLQSLILYSFYLLISGQTNAMTQINGLQVRLAQSLGMHRHARRFKFTQNETELRKRMWWWVYGYDKLTSIVHGMPKLINDIDVDNDLPVDCELSDTNAQSLSHPLPGEPSPVALFIQYIQLCKILSAILSQLYTTSQRRGGEEKIASLDRDLRNWHQGFCATLQIPSYDLHDVEKTLNRARWQTHTDDECAMIAYLDLLVNFTIILIHRPALTFDNTTSRFKESLNICMRSCTAVIELTDSSEMHKTASSQIPFGRALIFQSALMQIFHDLSVQSSALPNGPNLLRKAVNNLHDITLSQTYMPKVISLLETLLANLETLTSPRGASSTVSRMPDISSQSIVIPTDDGLTDEGMWVASSLESLNHLDVFYSGWESTDFLPT